ncbi:hypothetical protein KGF54_001242 [Candida jiufengensis]|uniref:uncharacterized protein n=1 Tax=Candida jiufengensis TaxID=497108 RepID=UPI002223F741|nr:uncharacterized protein KGF54_001242 [Candida jiufengensis]KAI5955740.1 hypothetical protein KGF54_001242 [Candida jiufengensis]
MDDGKVQQLQEMGFSKYDSENALKQANYNLENAINYLFEGTLANENHRPEPLLNDNYNSDTVQISNPQDIPHIHQLTTYESNNNDNNWGEPILEEVTFFNDPREFERNKSIPPAVVSVSQNGGCVSALFVVLSQISYLKKLILSQNLQQDFTEDWYNSGQQITEEGGLTQIQRIFAFFTKLSERSFISAEGLCNALPEELINLQGDSWEESWNLVADYLMQEVNKELDQDIRRFFLSKFRIDEDDVRYMKAIGIEFASRDHSITETLNDVLSKAEGMYEIMSPMFAIEFQGTEYPESARSFTIEEYIYPELYSSKYRQFIDEMDLTKVKSAEERKLTTSRMMSLTSFEGKKIRSILENTKNHLSKIDKESSDDISRLTENIETEYAQLGETLHRASDIYAKYDSSNPQNILKLIEEDETLESPSKYVLIAVMLSESQYLYRTCESNSNGPIWSVYAKMANEFRTEYFTFEDVVNYVTEELNQTSKNVLFVYADEKVLENEEIEYSSNLVEFFKKDNELIKDQIEGYEAEDINIDENDNDKVNVFGDFNDDIIETEKLIENDSSSDLELIDLK